MEQIVNKQKLPETAFILAFVIFIIKNILDSSSLVTRPGIVDDLLVLVFLILILYKLFTQTYSKIGLLFMGVSGVICLYSSLTLKYFSLLCSFLCICAVQNVDIRKVLKISARTKIIILAVHVIAYIFLYCLKPEVITFVYRNGLRRHYFFLGHANLFTGYLTWACLELLYVYYKKIRNWHLLLMWVVSIIFYQFTDSNTGTIVLTAIILMTLIEKKNIKSFNKGLSFLSKYGFALVSIFFPFITILYTRLNIPLLSEFWKRLNEGLTGRLLYGAYAYDTYGFTVLGRRIGFPEKVLWRGHWIDNIIFDNSYLWLFIQFGIIHLVVLSISFFLIERRTSNIEKMLIIIFTFYGIMEAYVVNVIICFPLLFIGKYIYLRNKTNRQSLTEDRLWKLK